ncbi:hypothetical protein BDA96_07G017900 [Sorghum bicolor]|uniref:Uncharacterized protein n=2 Tax=Sorghum bicolor TaxID=4558 RepID=A0A921U8D5_SORBI|nr:hypothetical protein BDA96_07G017900 [Sorghum bicolor]KXG24267.1 hypothetical protein SORBI_3007G017000 [Sorghum bicolor]
MVSSIRHSRNSRVKGSASRVSNSSDGASQRARSDAPSQSLNATEPIRSVQSAKQRGRKQGCLTKLKMPVRGRKVDLEPLGDTQFTYAGYRGYKYSTQVGVILKREYPGLVDDKDQNGVVLNTRPALEWADYFLTPKDKTGQTAGDRVLSEFWRLFQVRREVQQEADRVLENYVRKKVKDIFF